MTAGAGTGVIFGVLDTGVWPEHPSLADQGNLPRPPRNSTGRPRECDFGDNPLTPAADPFVCNNKLIGGAAFLDTYLSNPDNAAGAVPHGPGQQRSRHPHLDAPRPATCSTSAPVFGVDRGPINGIAPGAWVSVYKVCGIRGCFRLRLGRRRRAGDPRRRRRDQLLDLRWHQPVHRSGRAGLPRRLRRRRVRVGLGRQRRPRRGDGQPPVAVDDHGRRLDADARVPVDADRHRRRRRRPPSSPARRSPPASSRHCRSCCRRRRRTRAPLCDAPAPAGTFAGKIVACQRGTNARVEKGFNVLQGGAAGMVLYNPALADIETDNHWLPTVHLADGTDFVAFMSANPGATASFTAGQPADGQGDVMAAFSSRGPAGNFIKPDITAPGVQILAGHTPVPNLEGVARRSRRRATSRRSPGPRCRHRTRPVRRSCSRRCTRRGHRARSSRR